MNSNHFSHLTHSAASSPRNILGNTLARLGRAVLFVSLALFCAVWSALPRLKQPHQQPGH
jgi:hypothetical protein